MWTGHLFHTQPFLTHAWAATPAVERRARSWSRRSRMIPTKGTIIEKIGESGVLLPELITRGLAAHDRLKYYLTLLQTAYTHALAPTRPVPNLRTQREASGVDDTVLDRVVEGSVDRGGGTVYIPGSCNIVGMAFEESRRMLQPLLVAGNAR